MSDQKADAVKKELVDVQGFGLVELREPLFDDIEEMFFMEGGAKGKPTDLLRKCLFAPGTDQRIFDKPVGAALGIQLMKLAPKVMAMVGLVQEAESDEKKDSAPAN